MCMVSFYLVSPYKIIDNLNERVSVKLLTYLSIG